MKQASPVRAPYFAIVSALLACSSLTELARDWCPLQTSYFQEGLGIYGCLPSDTGFHDGTDCYWRNLNDNELTETSCTQLAFCIMNHACGCDASEPRGPGYSVHTFDLHVDGASAEGSMEHTRAGDLTVLLERAS